MLCVTEVRVASLCFIYSLLALCGFVRGVLARCLYSVSDLQMDRAALLEKSSWDVCTGKVCKS